MGGALPGMRKLIMADGRSSFNCAMDVDGAIWSGFALARLLCACRLCIACRMAMEVCDGRRRNGLGAQDRSSGCRRMPAIFRGVLIR